MARTTEPSSSASAPPSPRGTLAATSSHRVKKTRHERLHPRNTRQRTQEKIASASASGRLQDVLEAQEVAEGAGGISGGVGKGKGKAKAVEAPETVMDESGMDTAEDFLGIFQEDKLCPVAERDQKPFRIMELPTEIRLEIYRACLTRPYNVLLSKREQPQQGEPEDGEKSAGLEDSHSDPDDTDDELQARVRRSRERRRVAPIPIHASTHRSGLATGLRGMGSRASRPIRLLSSRSAPPSAGNTSTVANGNNSQNSQNLPSFGTPSTNTGAAARSANARAWVRGRSTTLNVSEPPRNQTADPLLINILRASKEVYKEARSVLYSENLFTLDLNTAQSTLPCLHQRSRRQIKHIELEIPTYNEILERFQETVRLSLRYCTGLKTFVIHMPFTLPGADGSGTTGNTTVYANGFDILRWLPQQCDIILKGNVCVEIETVVNKHLQLARTLDKLAYARRQLISNDTGPPTTAAAIATTTV